MKSARRFYQMLLAASVAHARWDYETSRNILTNRKKLWVLLLMLLPILLVSLAVAAQQLPNILGGKEAYSPAFYTPSVFAISILIGLCAGLITGCIGAGGGFIITPALMSAGIKAPISSISSPRPSWGQPSTGNWGMSRWAWPLPSWSAPE